MGQNQTTLCLVEFARWCKTLHPGYQKIDSIRYRLPKVLFQIIDSRAALLGAGNEKPVGSGRVRSISHTIAVLFRSALISSAWLRAETAAAEAAVFISRFKPLLCRYCDVACDISYTLCFVIMFIFASKQTSPKSDVRICILQARRSHYSQESRDQLRQCFFVPCDFYIWPFAVINVIYTLWRCQWRRYACAKALSGTKYSSFLVNISNLSSL